MQILCTKKVNLNASVGIHLSLQTIIGNFKLKETTHFLRNIIGYLGLGTKRQTTRQSAKFKKGLGTIMQQITD